jgi:60 kDa SS-A/Ro ribonucleoprotein
MQHPISPDMTLSCAEVAFAMAMVTSQIEEKCQVVTFSSDNNLEELELSPQMTLNQIISMASKREWKQTDCSLPMVWALKNKIEVDVFIIYTDNETYAGSVLPSVALEEYRLATGIEAKLVIVGMTSNGFSIANPNDVGSLDVVGFDTSTPQLISSFVN